MEGGTCGQFLTKLHHSFTYNFKTCKRFIAANIDDVTRDDCCVADLSSASPGWEGRVDQEAGKPVAVLSRAQESASNAQNQLRSAGRQRACSARPSPTRHEAEVNAGNHVGTRVHARSRQTCVDKSESVRDARELWWEGLASLARRRRTREARNSTPTNSEIIQKYIARA